MLVRPADPAELAQLAQLWHDAWRDAHAALVPPQLTRLRTVDNFSQRLAAAIADVRVVGPVGAPRGLCMIKDDELYQLFVRADSRGTGVAAALLADGERRLLASGVAIAWLACAIGNDRAAAFYEKHGWQRTGTVVNQAETSEGVFPLPVWRYEKQLA
jgi:GNAT superfamily N-acetyltransferase